MGTKTEKNETAQNELPFQPISEFDVAGWQTVRNTKNATILGNMYKVKLDSIVIRENFNVREDMGNLEELANSIKENGQIELCHVDVLKDENFLLTDGHRRYFALCILRDRGETDFLSMKCLVNDSRTTDEQRIVKMFTTQDNKQLTPNEVAKLFKYLLALKLTQHEIAKKVGKTDAYVSQIISYGKECDEVKDYVAKGLISYTSVIDLQKKIPDQDERLTRIRTAIFGEAKGNGKKPDALKAASNGVIANNSQKDNLDEIEDEDFDFKTDGKNQKKANDTSEYDNRDNTKTTASYQIDTSENSSGPAIEVPKKVSAADVAGKINRREKLEALANKINTELQLNLDKDKIIDLYEILNSNI